MESKAHLVQSDHLVFLEMLAQLVLRVPQDHRGHRDLQAPEGIREWPDNVDPLVPLETRAHLETLVILG